MEPTRTPGRTRSGQEPLIASAVAASLQGQVVLGPRAVEGTLLQLAALLPAALLPALVAVNTFAGDRRLVLDARAAGLVFALIATWRRAPFVVVVAGAAVAGTVDVGAAVVVVARVVVVTSSPSPPHADRASASTAHTRSLPATMAGDARAASCLPDRPAC